MANVVPLHTRGSGHYTLPEPVMNDLRLRMHDWYPRDLAREMGVTVGCIYTIRSGRTKWPRGNTFFALLSALNIEFYLVDGRTGKPL